MNEKGKKAVNKNASDFSRLTFSRKHIALTISVRAIK
jgi:hypothetical protein